MVTSTPGDEARQALDDNGVAQGLFAPRPDDAAVDDVDAALEPEAPPAPDDPPGTGVVPRSGVPGVGAPGGEGLLRSNVIVAVGTALSRLTGMLRVVVFGIVIGQTSLADAYNGANSSPNVVYELLLGGVLSATLVPMFARHLERDDKEATEAVVSVALIALVVLTAIAVIAAPAIFHLFSLSPAEGVDVGLYRNVGTWLTRVFLIQIFFYGVAALFGAILNARRQFFAAAWSPVLANVFICLTLLAIPAVAKGEDAPLLGDLASNPGVLRILGLGATVGIAFQALALLPALHRSGVRLRFRFDRHHPAVKQLITMSGWTFGYVAANQVASLVAQNLADPGSGRLDAYNKAAIFFYFPHGLLAMSIATTFVPDMARAVARRDKRAFIDRTSLGLRLIALLTIPAGFGFLVLRRPIIGALMQHGNFSALAAETTSRALAGFSLGLAGFSIYLFALRALYAHHDTRSPFIIGCFQNGLNIVFAFVLVDRYDVLGLGLAFALSYLICAAWVVAIIGYKVPGFPSGAFFRRIVPMILAAVVMAEIVWFITDHIGSNTGGGALVRVIVGTLVGTGVYVGILHLLKVPEIAQIRRYIPGLRSR